MNAETMAKCESIVEYFIDLEEAVAFQEPVDWKAYGLLDYPKVISHPMDLSTVLDKLHTKRYGNPESFVLDMQLIFNNCMTYNDDKSDLHVLAKELMYSLNEKVKSELKLEGNIEQVSTQEKVKLSQEMYKLSSDQLGELVMLLDGSCPLSLEKKSADELLINVDNVDGGTFVKMKQFLAVCMAQKKKAKEPTVKKQRL